MARYRSKPVEIEAERFFGEGAVPLPFADLGLVCLHPEGYWYVTTIHGQETKIADGDWIILEPDGEHAYPCKPDIFKATYEAVS